METYEGTGVTICKSSAVWATEIPYTTQQIAVDNGEVVEMRACTGVIKNPASAIIVRQ